MVQCWGQTTGCGEPPTEGMNPIWGGQGRLSGSGDIRLRAKGCIGVSQVGQGLECPRQGEWRVPEATGTCGHLREVTARASWSQRKGEPAVRWDWKDGPSQTLQLRPGGENLGLLSGGYREL